MQKSILAADIYDLKIYEENLSSYDLSTTRDATEALGLLVAGVARRPIDLLIAPYNMHRDPTARPLVIEGHETSPSTKIILTFSSVIAMDRQSLDGVIANLGQMGIACVDFDAALRQGTSTQFAYLVKPLRDETLVRLVQTMAPQ